ncbi:NAD(P)-dependent dehydrogenase, short-chain alcohol dehydrogenase family [Ferrimonas sediminum]|uniref:NAD(P)-dependent dehydrogenase, short-chain alcohol dehydrogenase family n=1 Tax=Ferrimonas sediminum TaxID=718193 RepID=A0A1G8M7I8_9GAMM|nr:SDR family NAD(P)-dependent oxidoreductase [Ferrimonas sediminum]SDI63855.1 NAD(P)-dependent dehydrogenase, short-chain alcohol dehydrogenase family [Ferrimonas sediminum]
MTLHLIAGAGGGLGQALTDHCLTQSSQQVVAVSRQAAPGLCPVSHPRLTRLQCDNSVNAIAAVMETLMPRRQQLARVTLCNGRLHDNNLSPEKCIEKLEQTSLSALFHSNTVVPALWLSQLLPLLQRSPHCIVTVLSARVGSIGDNRLGGWYSYRASKAALNQILQTAAVEAGRRAKGVKLVAYHPGTVDTPLSRPFQSRLAPGQLLSPQRAARRLMQVTENLVADGTLSYLDWRGEPIPW